MMSVMKDYWYGIMPLWKAFLLWGVLGYAGIFMIGLSLSFAEDSWLEIPIYYFPPIICFTVFFLYCAFTFLAIWRCGDNSARYWKLLSRVYIFLATPIILLFSFLVTLMIVGWPIEKFYPIRHEEARKVFGLYHEADMSIRYNPYDDKVDIDVGRVNKSGKIPVRTPVTFTLDELEYFFGRQKHKNLIAVMFKKSTFDPVVLANKRKKLNAYFFSKGYKRVVLLQGYGTGVGLYSDMENPYTD